MRKETQLREVQATSWGAWADDQAVASELERLRAELSQAHTLHMRAQQEGREVSSSAAAEAAQMAAEMAALRKRGDAAVADASAASRRITTLEEQLSASQGEASAHAQTIAGLQEAERSLQTALSQAEGQARVSSAQVETLEEEIMMLCAAAHRLRASEPSCIPPPCRLPYGLPYGLPCGLPCSLPPPSPQSPPNLPPISPQSPPNLPPISPDRPTILSTPPPGSPSPPPHPPRWLPTASSTHCTVAIASRLAPQPPRLIRGAALRALRRAARAVAATVGRTGHARR